MQKWFQNLRLCFPLERGIARLDFNKINVCIKAPLKRDYMSDLNRLMYASRRRPIEKVVVLSIHGYVSIYRRAATQPLGLRWGFETTSNQLRG